MPHIRRATMVCILTAPVLYFQTQPGGRLAQLARARRSHRRGHWFESSIAHHASGQQSGLYLGVPSRSRQAFGSAVGLGAY